VLTSFSPNEDYLLKPMYITVLYNENIMKLYDMNYKKGIIEKEHMNRD
jgi:hypothetical protein